MKPNLKVSVCMITYGHEKYIREAIEGVLMQECDFEVELIISNDNSPDNTDEVIRNIIATNPKSSWIKYIKQEKNLGMASNFIFTMKQCSGNYIALCEGDDYWTDSLKLKKQVNFLEANREASGCFHHASFVDEKGEIIDEIYNSHISDMFSYNQKECLTNLGSSYATCSLVFRSEAIIDLPIALLPELCDELLDIAITEKGALHFLDFNGANYRCHPGGVWSGRQEMRFNLIRYKRMEALYKVPVYKKRYSSYLKVKIFLLAKGFIFSNSVSSKTRVLYFFKTLKILNYCKKDTYLFFVDFLICIIPIKKIFKKQYA